MSSIEHRVILPKPGRIIISVLMGLAIVCAIVFLESVLVSRGLTGFKWEKLYLGLALFLGALIGTDHLRRGKRGTKGLCALLTALAMEITIIVTALIAGKGSVGLGIMLWQMLCLVTGGITDCIIFACLKRS